MKTAHLNPLRALEASLRLGGFREAASELGVTPAAVGQQIRVLEDYLGRPLFDRLPGGAVPTSAAVSVGDRLTASFRDLGEVLEALCEKRTSSRVAVTMTIAIAEGWLPRELPDFFRSVREADLRLDSRRAMVDLRDGEFDFAIRHLGEAEDRYGSLHLFPSYVAPVCTPNFARRYGLGAGTRSLDGVPLGHVEVATSDPEWLDWPDWCARFGIEGGMKGAGRQVSVGTGNVALASAGLALVLTALVDSFDAIKRGELILPFGTGHIARTAYSYKLLWLKDRHLSKVQRQFRDWIDVRAAAQREAINAFL